MKINRLSENEITMFTSDENMIFISYNTPVAAYINGKPYRTEKKWSVTTSKQIKRWLGTEDFNKAEVKEQSFFDNLL